MKLLSYLFICVLSLSQLSIWAQREGQFVVQTGHSSDVIRLEFSQNGDILASAGNDHNIVLWELESGKQLRLLNGHRDQINDLVFMHGDTILASCSKDSSIRFWNTFTGELVAQTKTTFQPKTITYNSKDRKCYIAAKVLYNYSLEDKKLNIVKSPKKKSIDKVFALNSGKIIFGGEKSGHHYILSKDSIIKKGGSIQFLDQQGGSATDFVITTRNGNIVLYEDTPDKIKYIRTLRTGMGSANEIKGVAIAEKGIIVMTRDNTCFLLNKENGVQEKTFISNYYKGSSVAIHPQKQLFVSGANDGKIYLWDTETGVLIREFKSNSSSINFAKFSLDGDKVILGYDAGLIRIWDLNYGGTLRTYKFRLNNKQMKKGWRYRVLSLTSQTDSVYSFRIALTKPYPGTEYFKEVRFYDFVWNINSNEHAFTEKYIENYDFEVANYDDIVDKQNLVFQNDSIFIIGNGTFVDEFIKDDAKNTGFQTPHSNPITSVDYYLPKDIYITTSWDGKILLYNGKRQNIASLVALGVDDFVIVNKQNYYYATKGALQYVGFTDGHEVQSFQQFDLQYNRPELVYESIPYGDELTIAMLGKLHEKRLERSKSLGHQEGTLLKAPSIELISISGPVSQDGLATIRVTANDEVGLRKCQLRIDGVPTYTSGKDIFGRFSIDTTFSIELQSGINKVEFSAVNVKDVNSINKSIYIKYDKKNKKPELYFVGLGVSQYDDTLKNLKYAQKDILDVEKTLKKSKIFSKTHSFKMFNQGVVKDSLNKIDDFLADANVSDVVIVYYAGHGILSKDLDYFLASHDMDFFQPEKKAIPYQALEDKLINCQSRKKLLFLDACHSGEVDTSSVTIRKGDVIVGKDIIFRSAGISIDQEESLDAVKAVFADLKESNGITVISSAGGADYAIESDQWQNGAFTYCLTKGLKSGQSDLDANGVTTVSDLLLYLQINVPILTHGYQVPTYRTENIDNDFVLWKK